MTMIERVAVAIAKDQGVNWGAVVNSLGSQAPILQMYRSIARAAIEAMREPTASMLFAAETHDPSNPWYEVPQAWEKMIDEALKE